MTEENILRVIAGKARRLQLKTVDGINTRPTTDRIKETLFNIINNNLQQSLFLDLYSGSGGIGIEALSRGAKKAYFVENNKAAVQCIRENLFFTSLENDGVVMCTDVNHGINDLNSQNICFDFIFMDPPYNMAYEKNTLDMLRKTCLADCHTLIIVEASLDTDFSYAEHMGYKIIRDKRYKTNKHIFLKTDGE